MTAPAPLPTDPNELAAIPEIHTDDPRALVDLQYRLAGQVGWAEAGLLWDAAWALIDQLARGVDAVYTSRAGGAP